MLIPYWISCGSLTDFPNLHVQGIHKRMVRFLRWSRWYRTILLCMPFINRVNVQCLWWWLTLLQASKEAVLRQIGEAECIHLATHMSWKLSAIVLSPGSDIVDPEHPKRFFSPVASSSSGGMAGQTATVSGVLAVSDQGDEEGSEVCECHHYYCTVIPRLTKIIRSGITFVSRNVSNFLLPLGLSGLPYVMWSADLFVTHIQTEKISSWNGLTVHVCCFMLARASTKTFVSRIHIR
jgi:hypothetical protein